MAVLSILTQIALLLVIGVILKEISDRIKFPYIVLLILGGTMLASYGFVNLQEIQPLPEIIRTIALIIVVFSSAFYLRPAEMKAETRNILWLATFGVIASALIISLTSLMLLPIPLVIAAFLGALLCGTDPATIAYAFSEKQNKLKTILRAESLFNTPLTVILPLLLLDFVVRPENIWWNVPKLFSLIIVGAVVGVLAAKIGQHLLNKSKAKHQETVGLIIAIATYVLAENLFGSGILAVAICSCLLMSGEIPRKKWLGEFNKELAFLFTLFVFVLLGTEFEFASLFFSRIEIFVIILALFAGRLLMTLTILTKSGLTLGEKLKISLVAPRGIAPAALAPLLLLYPAFIATENALFVVKTVYLAIIISTLISLVALQLFIEEKSEEETIKEKIEEKREKREKKK